MHFRPHHVPSPSLSSEPLRLRATHLGFLGHCGDILALASYESSISCLKASFIIQENPATQKPYDTAVCARYKLTEIPATEDYEFLLDVCPRTLDVERATCIHLNLFRVDLSPSSLNAMHLSRSIVRRMSVLDLVGRLWSVCPLTVG